MVSRQMPLQSDCHILLRNRRFALGLLGATALALGLPGCASKPVVSQIQLSLGAAADVNPDSKNRPSPIAVRIYALKTATVFESSDFFSLFEKDSATLGQEIVKREELLLRAGETKQLDWSLPPEAKFLAVLGAYRDLEHARWRAVKPIEVGKAVNSKIKFGARLVSFE
jgi:type VI secretion system protein VasD